MGRPEDKLPPTGARAELAGWLRRQRKRAALTYGVMAEMTGLSATTLSRAASGTPVPTLKTVLAYAQACGADVATATVLRTRAVGAHPRRAAVRGTDIHRPERVATRADLIAALNYARIRAGLPTLRQLERSTGMPDATISDLLTGKVRNPRLDVIRTLACACGESDRLDQWTAAWKRAMDPNSGRRPVGDTPASPPRPPRRETRDRMRQMIWRYYGGSLDDLANAMNLQPGTITRILKGVDGRGATSHRRFAWGIEQFVRDLSRVIGIDAAQLLHEVGMAEDPTPPNSERYIPVTRHLPAM